MSDIKKVTIVTPEYYGDTMVGGLAVSVHGLAHALKKKGCEVHVVMPAYKKSTFADKFTSKPYLDSGSRSEVAIDHHSRDGIDIHKITGLNLTKLTNYSNYIEFPDIEDAAYKTAMRETFESYQLLGAAIPYALDKAGLQDSDVIHLMEWTTASSAYWLRQNKNYSDKPIVLTSHNLTYTGEVPIGDFEKTGFTNDSLLKKMRSLTLEDDQGNLFRSLLELGIHYADFVNTVSPTEANEVLEGRKGISPRLSRILNEKGLIGILNGIDPTIMNPETDQFIERYHTGSYESIARGKKENKVKLKNYSSRSDFNRLDPEKMLISMMCRLAEQKSIKEVIEASRKFKSLENVQVLIAGEPADSIIRSILFNMSPTGGNLIVYHSFANPELQHQILAASDAILQPSKWEPCGYTQLEGMAYGAVPIVTAVGGHKDTVEAFNGERGYGIFIDEQTPDGIYKGIEKAVELCKDEKAWRKIVMNAVKADFTWSGPRDSVGKYLKLYEKAAAIHKEKEPNPGEAAQIATPNPISQISS